LCPQNDDEIIGVYILETLDPSHLFNSLNTPTHPTILQANHEIIRSSDVNLGKNKFQIPETTALSLHSQSHLLVNEASEAEAIDLSSVFRPHGPYLCSSD
jgi:hypothetical protein